MGTGRFLFSDRYSVFDWGEMPDHIEGKGAALCLMGAYCFEQLEKLGVKTHYRGLVDEKGKAVRVGDLKEPSSIMEVALVNVYKPNSSVVRQQNSPRLQRIHAQHSKTASSHSKSSTATAYPKAHQSSNVSHRAKSP